MVFHIADASTVLRDFGRPDRHGLAILVGRRRRFDEDPHAACEGVGGQG
jgi:hypothetical protein